VASSGNRKEKAATLIALITRGVSEGGDGGERGDNSRHPRSGRHRYSAHRYARGRDPVGWLFLISGIVGLITTFRMRQAPGFWWSLVSAILGIAVGIVLGALSGGRLDRRVASCHQTASLAQAGFRPF
jgi:Short repeat of unknown function (DUF308)